MADLGLKDADEAIAEEVSAVDDGAIADEEVEMPVEETLENGADLEEAVVLPSQPQQESEELDNGSVAVLEEDLNLQANASEAGVLSPTHGTSANLMKHPRRDLVTNYRKALEL